ncbi:restriction endonuclease subunit S [Patescibacteria group bacterium]|nr:restriction endonuclease subunit S [Patescibacteria group bacterium]
MNLLSSKKWQPYPVYSLADWINGLAFRDINFSDDRKGVPVIKINELKNGIGSQTAFTKDSFDKKYFLNKGDMLFSWSGSPETSIDIYWFDLPEGWLNQHIFKVLPDANLVDKKFFFYLLKSQKSVFVHRAKQRQTTGLGHVTVSDLKNLIVSIPESKDDQRSIAALLGSLDDKIELLRAENTTLERMAETIFKEWFVDFRFPGATGVMVDSELGKIPEGWRVGTVMDVIERLTITYRCDKDDLDSDGKTPIIDQGTTSIYGYTKRDPDMIATAEAPVIVFTNHTCNLWLINYPFCAIQNVIPFKGKNGYDEFFIYFMTKGQIEFIEYKGHWPDFEIKEYIIPLVEIAKKYSSVVQPMVYRIWSNNKDISNLSRLRDELLNNIFSH